MNLEKNDHPLNGFFTHGVERNGRLSGDEYETNCVFCQRENKLYVNMKTLCWQCKVCGLSGNYLIFLQNVAAYNKKYMNREHMETLCSDRRLPKEAFDGTDIGFDGQKYTVPIYNYDNTFYGLKNFYISLSKNRMRNQKGIRPNLYGLNLLSKNMRGTVYICEGEWDAMAMNWLIKTLGKDGVAVAVPSANAFDDAWVELFYKRNIVCMYDNDPAGKSGEEKAYALLKDIVSSLAFVHWPSSYPEGFDTRDHISEVAYKHKKPKRCWNEIYGNIHKVPRSMAALSTHDDKGRLELDPKYKEKLEPISFSELVAQFQSYLYLPDTTPIKVVLASLFANRLDGEMIWLFLVAPPSSAKSEFIQSLDLLDITVPISRLTQHTLSSGFLQNKTNKEVSLLPKLNGKVAIIKDFTSVLAMHQKEQDDIFGQLRDAYDGRTDYYYGHGQNKHFRSKFGLVAGVTEVIERLNGTGSLHTALGERFLRYRLPKDMCDVSNIDKSDIMHKMGRAMQNTGHETKHKESLMMAVKRFMEAGAKDFQASVPDVIARQLKYLAWFTSIMRGFVDRDRDGNVNYKPGAESPIRLVKQLYRFAIGLARVGNNREVTQDDLLIVRKIALDTCPSRIVSFVKALHDTDGAMQYKEIAAQADFDAATVSTVLNDMTMLKLIVCKHEGSRRFYTLSELSKALIEKSALFVSPAQPALLPAVPQKLVWRRSAP